MTTNTPPPRDDDDRVPVIKDAATDLTWEDWQTLFQTTLDGIKRWNEEDYPMYQEHQDARHHLHDLARALVLVSESQLRQDAAWRASHGMSASG